MRLIGVLDSPYVRRVAISMTFMELPFTHERLSVFRHFEELRQINPVVKAPTLVTDDGVVLMESSLILDYLQRLVPPERHLVPSDLGAFTRSQRITGLALVACEKTVQIAYERMLRPLEKQHQPWIDRVHGQLLAAYDLIEREIGPGEDWLFGARPLQADITTAVAWRFTQGVLAEMVLAAQYPGLARFSARSEALPQFLACPFDG